MNNTMKINFFNGGNRNITNIKAKHCQIMTAIKDRILKFKPMIEKPIVANYMFFLYCYYFWQDKFLSLNQFYRNTAFITPSRQNQKTNLHQSQKDFHQDNVSFAFLQGYIRSKRRISRNDCKIRMFVKSSILVQMV